MEIAYILLMGVAVVISVYYYFYKYRKNALLNKMSSAVDMVKIGLFCRLSSAFEQDFGKEKAGLLAAAITNELFSESSSNAQAEEFFKSNRKFIEGEIRKLQSDSHICHMITQAVRIMSTIDFARNRNKPSIDRIMKIREYDILVPGGEAPSPSKFMQEAGEFYLSSDESNM